MNDLLIDEIRQLSREEKLFLLDLLWDEISDDLLEKQYADESPEGLELRLRISTKDDNRFYS